LDTIIYFAANVEEDYALTSLNVNNSVIGNVWENGEAKICRLANIQPDDLTAIRDIQTEQVF